MWTGYGSQYGYGIVRRPDTGVHRLAYRIFVGPIPDGMTIDHLCHKPEECAGGVTCPHRRCCNPAHLAVAGRGPNALRGNSPPGKNSRKTNCGVCGRPYDEANTYIAPPSGRRRGSRQCRACRREQDRKRQRKRGLAA
jgi:hypothetical protein